MATFTDISNEDIKHKKPITVSVGRALRDNPIAMMEGEAGAPRLFLRTLERLAAGNQVRLSASGVAEPFRHGFFQSGSIRLKATIPRAGTSSPGTWTLRRIRNGASVTLGTWSPGTSEEISVDIPLLAGDIVALASVPANSITEITLGTAGQDLWPDISNGYGVVGNRT